MRKYLIDSNVFIQAKNFFYKFDFCEAFWDWMHDAHSRGLVFSIKKVKKELQMGNDDCPAKAWAEALPSSFFLEDAGDPAVMSNYGKLIDWAQNGGHYKQTAINEFAKPNVADAFLIAVAKTHSFSIVSQEESNPAAKKKIYLPDAANAMGVTSIPYYELLTRHATATFKFK